MERGELELGDAQQLQWRNKALNDTYEPGSTFKILTLSAALEEGLIDMNTTVNCSGSVNISGHTIHCSNKAGHGLQTLEQSVGNSCNPAFISYGLKLGNTAFYEYMRSFGLMEGTGIDLSGDKVAMQRLKEAAEKAKIELSGVTTSNINLPYILSLIHI